ncbi:uncharacterized protein LOC128894180 [Hylaeus anthracinus]|uniref:uncharacterized protein LOC128894180 n=1 Tax=Hylaeus anthracinus TaxID=313031 RepID=UPI0023B8E10A|nr:uncharacterized protein LOC128894180 [Hylaeus anthracinus]
MFSSSRAKSERNTRCKDQEKMFFLLLSFCALRWCVVQAHLDLMLEDAECVYASAEYVKEDSCTLEVNDDSEYGSTLSSHIEVIKQLPDGIKARGNINGLYMGEYTNDVGIHIDTNLCEMISLGNDNIATPMIRAIDLSSKDCPPGPGVYGKEKYVIDNFEGIPKTFPSGKYLVNVTLAKDEDLLLHYQAFITIV